MEAEKARLKAEIEQLRARLDALEGGAVVAANGELSTPAAVEASAPPATAAAATPADTPPSPSYRSPHGLTKPESERYSRQLLLPSFGPAAQARLCRGAALVVGCGGLGAPAALYLAAAGAGRLGLVDHDLVEISNLHRQIIHTEARSGTHKADSAAAAVAALNSSVRVDVYRDGLWPSNAARIVAGYDVVLDCSDNAPTRYLLSDACAAAGVPLVSAAAVGTDGQLTVYCLGEDGPCYRCAVSGCALWSGGAEERSGTAALSGFGLLQPKSRPPLNPRSTTPPSILNTPPLNPRSTTTPSILNTPPPPPPQPTHPKGASFPPPPPPATASAARTPACWAQCPA